MRKILLYDSGQVINSLNNPIGGSELTIYYLSKGLSELGNSVVLLCNTNLYERSNNLVIDHFSTYENYVEKADILILNRFFPHVPKIPADIPVFLYLHDAYDQSNVQILFSKYRKILLENENIKFLCVSEWQKNTFIEFFELPGELQRRFYILPNPIYTDYYIDSEQYYSTKKDLKRLIFCSVPFKGLEYIPYIFEDIQLKVSDVKLYVFSSEKLYNRDDADDYKKILLKLSNMKNVFVNEPVSNHRMAYELKLSSVLLHPHVYHETFGRVFIESFASFCLPVTTNKGSALEVIQDDDLVIKYPNIENIDAYTEYINKIVNILNNPDEFYRKRKFHYYRVMKFYNYVNISKMFLGIVNGKNKI